MSDFLVIWSVNVLLTIAGFALGFFCGASWAGHFRKRKDGYAEWCKAESTWTVMKDGR